MRDFSIANLYFDPFLSFYFILFISLIFLTIIIFSLINKSSGIFLRLGIFILITLLMLKPGYRIEKIENENDIITFVIDKTDSQKISKRIEEVDKTFNKMLLELTKFKDLDILEIVIDNEKITKRLGNIEEIISNTKTKEVVNKITKSTDIINNLENSINEYPSQRISSIFILTDGQIHDLKDNANFEKFDVPIYFLLIGNSKIDDTKVSIISHPEFGYLDEKITIQVLANDFKADENSFLNLTIQNGTFSEKKLKVPNNDVKNIELKLKNHGPNFIKVTTPNRQDELSAVNNSQLINISGVRKKLRVLLISGAPYMGTRVWRNFLKSDTSVELIHMTVLRPPEKNDNTPLEELSLIPFPVKELFEEKLSNFQLVIFDNFEGKKVLTPLYFQNLINFVDKGGAILEITGPSYNSKSSLFKTEIGRILPGIPSGKLIQKEFKPQLTDLGKKHPITESLFIKNKDFGTWFQMNDILEIDDDSQVLLSGVNNKPLLAVKKVNDGRIAQIYSHNIWLWSKRENNQGGPYNLLIKNLAHWLMKEPTLEENKLELSFVNNSILIEKSFLRKPDPEKLKITIIDPNGIKFEKTLNKSKENRYTAIINNKKDGFYLVYDGEIEKGINTSNENKRELQDFHLTDNIIKKSEISNIFSKAVWINDHNIPVFEENINISSKEKKDKALYIKRNQNSFVEEIENKQLLNPAIILLLIIILFYFCWKKESE
ncbi:hypothetical protein OA848_01670 [Rickettsiales bacterium]|nr:hypothetical protein [Rickettsiales bacterium]